MDTHADACTSCAPGHEVHAEAEPEHVRQWMPQDWQAWPCGKVPSGHDAMHSPWNSTLLPGHDRHDELSAAEHVRHEASHGWQMRFVSATKPWLQPVWHTPVCSLSEPEHDVQLTESVHVAHDDAQGRHDVLPLAR